MRVIQGPSEMIAGGMLIVDGITAKLKRPKVRETKLRKTAVAGTEHAVATHSRQALGRLQRLVSDDPG